MTLGSLERLKTLPGGNKKASTKALRKGATAHHPELETELDAIFRALTGFHNTAMIRHSETEKVKVDHDSDLLEF